MAAFRFEAATPTGKLEHGVLDADSPRHARSQLRSRGLTPLQVSSLQQVTDQKRTASRFQGKISTTELTLATRQLSSLLSARLPIEQAIAAVAEQGERRLVRERFAAVRSDVVSGQSFADALAKYPRDFPDVYRALVAAGEQSGDLAMVMDRLADYVESRSALTQKVILAFTYPAIVTLVAMAVIIALLTYVVPQVVSVFDQTDQALPNLTIALIAVSDFIRNWGWLVAIILVVGFALFRLALRSPSARLNWDKRLLNAPILGRVVRGMNTSRFTSTLSILTRSGVPLISALEAGAATLSNQALKNNVDDAISRVREGSTLARALGAEKQFSPMVIHMISSGEATGELAEMLERTAQTVSGETERRVLGLTSLLEPLLILAMGGIVLLIVLAVMMPIIEINQLVR
ncbi:MAG: type II secretion system inner membrane protein GspF [Burkholderiaceae bacterium]